MTPDDQNMAIAKACGYKDLAVRMVGDPMCCGFWALCSGRVGEGGVATPMYTEDLNAMHKAEKQIEGSTMWNRYTDELAKLRHYHTELHTHRTMVNIVVSATAAERAEAFLKTLGLWTE